VIVGISITGLLSKQIQAYKRDNSNISMFALSAMLTQYKKANDWLYRTKAQSLVGMLHKLDAVFTNFFRKRASHPKYKTNKDQHQSYTVPQRHSVNFKNRIVKIPKVGHVKAKLHKTFEGPLKTMTVSRTPTGKYFVSIIIDDGNEIPAKQPSSEKNTIRNDLGIKDFAILSNGEKIPNPKFLQKALQKLKILQKRVSRKKKGSNNRKKAQQKLALLYEKITNQRNDFQHKLSIKLIGENQAIAVESLNVSGLMRNHRLAQAISDATWGGFLYKLEYKAQMCGKTILKIGTFEPSSKRCSVCGYVNSELKLKHREWTCPECPARHMIET
jgi:putative transposase